MIKLTSKTPEQRAQTEREVLFEIDGTAYEIDTELSAAFGLAYVARSDERGVDAAHIWLLKNALGDQGYRALLGFADLDADDLAGIIQALTRKVNTALEPGKK